MTRSEVRADLERWHGSLQRQQIEKRLIHRHPRQAHDPLGVPPRVATHCRCLSADVAVDHVPLLVLRLAPPLLASRHLLSRRLHHSIFCIVQRQFHVCSATRRRWCGTKAFDQPKHPDAYCYEKQRRHNLEPFICHQAACTCHGAAEVPDCNLDRERNADEKCMPSRVPQLAEHTQHQTCLVEQRQRQCWAKHGQDAGKGGWAVGRTKAYPKAEA
eukprot:1929531-Rhodomonas_salina.2